MSTSKVLHLGGVGAAPSLDDVVKVASGLHVALDCAGADRLKKYSVPPKAFQPESDGPVEAAHQLLSHCLTEQDTRASIAALLMTVTNGRSGVRLQIAEYLCHLLNRGVVPALPSSGAAAMAALADACKGLGVTSSGRAMAEQLAACDIIAPGISSSERTLLSSSHPAAAGIGSLVVTSSKKLLSAATAVAALSLESAGAQVGYSLCWGIEHCPFGAGTSSICRGVFPGCHEPVVLHATIIVTAMKQWVGQLDVGAWGRLWHCQFLREQVKQTYQLAVQLWTACTARVEPMPTSSCPARQFNWASWPPPLPPCPACLAGLAIAFWIVV